jgi:hypothetical protein
MAFIIEDGTTISFAEYDDVYGRDQRLFENNEGLTDDNVEDLLIRATERILTKLRASDWWRSYYLSRNSGSINSVADIPSLDINKIKDRQNDFTDLCVYIALAEYVLPKVADFGSEDNAERQKIGYYNNKSESLFGELVTAGDWYDFDGDGTVDSNEKEVGTFNLKRIR